MTLVTGFFIQKKRGDFERFDRQRAPLSLSPREGRAEMPPPPLHERKSRGPKAWPLVSFALTSILVSGLSLGLRFSEKLSQNEKLRKEAEKERADQELILLKNQINPHFLFNTLNTIYSLALVNSEHTAEAVMKLSDMMRYVLQDVNREKVPVTLELDYIRHYVGLQQLRLNRNITVILEIDDDGGGQEIAPILLVPFVENVFKHGISAHEAAEILIRIRCQGNAVELKTVNRIFPDRIQEEVSGIGLTNTKKRLELIYPGSHTLALDDSGGVFTVNLVVRL
jgi:LytS/YehU family sensor histidine kinase